MASDSAQPVMLCRCGKVLESPGAYAAHCAAYPDHFTTPATYRDAALEDAAKIADRRVELPFADCERLGPMDWETGVRECSRESAGGACLCAERSEEAEEIARLIRALKGDR